MLGWFVETTLVCVGSGRCSGRAGRLWVDRPDGPARTLAGGPLEIDNASPVLLALGGGLERLEPAVHLGHDHAHTPPAARADDSVSTPGAGTSQGNHVGGTRAVAEPLGQQAWWHGDLTKAGRVTAVSAASCCCAALYVGPRSLIKWLA